MKLDLTAMKTGKRDCHDLNFELYLKEMDCHGDIVKIISPISVTGKLYVMGDKLYLTCDIETTMEANCFRCLKPFTYDFKSNVNSELVLEELVDTEENDEEVIVYHDNVLELDQVIQESIIMNMPMKMLCKESCQGLCTKCGKDLNEGSCQCIPQEGTQEENLDPRLAKLKELLQQD